MSLAADVERKLRGKTGQYGLVPNDSGKAEVWKKFSLVCEGDEPVKYLCACNKCFKVYHYKDGTSGQSYGTKNLLDHVKQCSGKSDMAQMTIRSCLVSKPKLSKQELSQVTLKQVMYCVNGYNSFRSVEHQDFIDLLQYCVDLGAKYGKFNVTDIMASRKVVSKQTGVMAQRVKNELSEELREYVLRGTVSACIDMYTDDYRKKAYLDIHATWINNDFEMCHAALAVRHFGTMAHTANNLSTQITDIFNEYGLLLDDTPVTTDHGSNIVAALQSNVRLDCLCHRLHTVLETAWRDTKAKEPEAAQYEIAASELCRYAKQATGIQEQLPKSLKHGGDTRPWEAMYRRAESIDASYDALVKILTAKDRLELVANVNRGLNRDIMDITSSIKDIFLALEKASEPTLNLAVPSYYVLVKKFSSVARDSKTICTLRRNLKKYLDDKYWSSIKAFHWMASFLDPTFKQLEFVPQVTAEEIAFKRNLQIDLDTWILHEMNTVEQLLASEAEGEEQSEQGVQGQSSTAEAQHHLKKLKLDPFADLRDGSGQNTTTTPASVLSSADELARYKAIRVPPLHKKGPLTFWKEFSQDYPIMSRVAQRIFSISASSAQSERDFSSVGHTLTDMRSRLSAQKVEAIELVRWGLRAGMLTSD